MNKFLNLLEEQCDLGFEGKINILRHADYSYVGCVWLKNGIVLDAQFGKKMGKSAFLQVAHLIHLNAKEFNTIVEPELVGDHPAVINQNYDEIKMQVEDYFKRAEDNSALRPQDHLKLLIRPRFLKSAPELTPQEFQILLNLFDDPTVGHLYEKVDLLDSEITHCLVSLRKKEAFEVVGQKLE
jgi:hypothetical protein